MQHTHIRKCLQNKKVVDFVERQYIASYSRYFVGHEIKCKLMIESAFSELKKLHGPFNQDKWNKTIYAISKQIFKIKDDSHWFNKMHYAYKTAIRPKKDFKAVLPYLTGKTIHDFGCDGGFFSLELFRNNYNVQLSDVVDHRIDEVKAFPFHLMKSPTDMARFTDSSDTTIVKTVLHHIDDKYLPLVIATLRKMGGRIIIEEDVYGVPPFIRNMSEQLLTQKNFKEYATLTDEEQYQYCVLTDYFSNAVIYGRPDITFPFNFKTVEEWTKLFQAAGFVVKKTIVNGFNDWKLTQNCQAWFILE